MLFARGTSIPSVKTPKVAPRIAPLKLKLALKKKDPTVAFL